MNTVRLVAQKWQAEDEAKRLKQEIERCADLAESIGRDLGEPAVGYEIAKAIRALGEAT